MEYFDINDNIQLLEKVFVDLMIYFGQHGRENIKDLNVGDFAATRDGRENVYISMGKDELTKNHQNDRNTAAGRMYARPDNHMCPVKTFMLYKKHRNPNCTAFFQCPKKSLKDAIWYTNFPLGHHNTLGGLMAKISEKVNISRRYTNHFLRATAVNISDKAQFPSRHIMSVTGHKAESSLKTYSGFTDSTTKKLMSDIKSKSLRAKIPPTKAQEPTANAPGDLDFMSEDFDDELFDQILLDLFINKENECEKSHDQINQSRTLPVHLIQCH